MSANRGPSDPPNVLQKGDVLLQAPEPGGLPMSPIDVSQL